MASPIRVPQRAYVPAQQFNAQPSVFFHTAGGFGVNLHQVRLGDYSALLNGDAVNNIPAPRIGIRILWPGYEDWFFRNLVVHNNSGEPYDIKRIANSLAGRIDQFLTEMRNNPPVDCVQWNLQGITLDRLYLVELRNVAAGSWQPIINFL
ncbi:hypothetical protein BDW22DRAFT_1344450 [Trametopsis cervina]|nr:hypothetical protein BDW22DRAFT_1344450 [Trametopsis cervina]